FLWDDIRQANWFVDPLEILRLFHVYVSFYILKFSLMVVIGVIQYYRYAVYYSLRQMNARLEKLSVKRLEMKVQKLAIANSQINKLLSFPLVLILFIYAFDIIIELSSLLFSENTGSPLYQLLITGNLLLILHF